MAEAVEPVFPLKPHQLGSDVLREWLAILVEQNETRMKSATLKQGYFIDGEYAECIFSTCQKLRLAAEARYLALELYEKFMVQHIRDLFSHVQQLDREQKQRDWQAILSRVQDQVVLRVVTCCELASKLTSHYRILTPRKVWRTLKEFGHSFSTESILQSELRVVKTLNYRVMLTTPLTYIETILVLIGQREPSLDVKQYHSTALKVLDIAYMKRREVFQSLFTLVHGHPKHSQADREKFLKIENDYVLLAGGVIAAAVYISHQSATNKVVEMMSDVLEIHCNDMIDFATVIIQTIMPESSDN